jgi:hypothetical protein
MKTYTQNLSILMMLLVFLTSGISVFAQQDENEVTKQERSVSEFTSIDVGGAFSVFVTQGDKQEVIVETKAKMQEKISTKVNDGVLYITKKTTLVRPKKLNVYITITELDNIQVSGAASFESTSVIKSDKLEVTASGASDLKLKLEIDKLASEISGAANVEYLGKANFHELEISGAANLDATNFETLVTHAEASGAANANVNAIKELDVSSSGISNIDFENTPPIFNSNIEEFPEMPEMPEFPEMPEMQNNSDLIFYASPDEDTLNINVAGIKIKVIENKGKTEVSIGDHKIQVNEDGVVNIKNLIKEKKKKRPKFDGHWAGIDIGINGYLTPDFDMNYGKSYNYLDLRMSKSIKVGVNLFEQNISLSKNQVFGITTGLGLEYNNYRFNNNVCLISDSSEIKGYYSDGVAISKNKLVATYLTLPVLFELQTNKYSKSNSFHFTAGMVFGLRIGSHTKKVFEELEKDYILNDPETGQTLFTATSPEERKSKKYNDFHLNPFRMDATARIGWGWVNVFATYSLTTLFKTDRGPELYPFSVGLTISDW